MKRLASDVLRELEIRVARLEREAGASDSVLARDLALSVANDGNMYRRMIQPNITNLAKKMSKDQYQEDLAVKAMMNIITAYLPQYKKDAGSPSMRVNKETKQEAAKELLEQFEDEIQEQAEDLKANKKASRRRYF